VTVTPEMGALLDPDELARLAERARLDAHTGIVGAPVSDDDDDDDEAWETQSNRDFALARRGVTGLRFAARAYAANLDEAGLMPAVWGGWVIGKKRYEFDTSIELELGGAVRACAARILEVPGLDSRLARSRRGYVRGAPAAALPRERLDVLSALARDPEPSVRDAARKKLGDDAPAFFPAPVDGIPEAALARARAVLAMPTYMLHPKPRRAVAALAALPDRAAVACWELLLSVDVTWKRPASTWIPRLVARPGGDAALVRLLERWAGRGSGASMHTWLGGVKRLPASRRKEAFDALVDRFRELESDDARAAVPQRFRRDLASCAVAIAPDRGDARALLETVLGSRIEDAARGSDAHDSSAWRLSEILLSWPLGRVRGALRRAQREGRPGRWRRVSYEVFEALGPDPVLRRRALRELDSKDPEKRRVAVLLLLKHRDPEKDGTEAALARRLFARPELRLAVLRHAIGIDGLARRHLLADRLTAEEAAIVLANSTEQQIDDRHWAAARRARDAALDGAPEERARVFEQCVGGLVRPGRSWDPSDLAFVRAAVDHALSSEAAAPALERIVLAICKVDGAESSALLRDIEARATSAEAKAAVSSATALRRRSAAV
jgi:hypothetical protein